MKVAAVGDWAAQRTPSAQIRWCLIQPTPGVGSLLQLSLSAATTWLPAVAMEMKLSETAFPLSSANQKTQARHKFRMSILAAPVSVFVSTTIPEPRSGMAKK